jgi:hypothetical protein
VLDRLDAPAQVMSQLGYTLAQNELAVALLGDQTHHTGPARSIFYRYFTDPAERAIYPDQDQEHHARAHVASLRMALSRDMPGGDVRELVARLTAASNEFARLWAEHQVAWRSSERKRLIHPAVGELDLDCQVLIAPDDAQVLLVYTATPGSEDEDKLRLLGVVGTQDFHRP